VAAAAASTLSPSAVELDWHHPGPLRAGVLLEGTVPGVAERARQMSGLLASAGASPAAAIGDRPPAWWGQLPAGGGSTVVRVSFWVSRLAEVLQAIMEAGDRPAISGSAGAGLLHTWLDPAVSHDAAARFVTALRERLEGSPPRGSVAVLAAPEPVLSAVGIYGQVPGLELMRAVKDQFDPGHRMCPGRF
jgi:glycolate oxidase FAD binding subunit